MLGLVILQLLSCYQTPVNRSSLMIDISRRRAETIMPLFLLADHGCLQSMQHICLNELERESLEGSWWFCVSTLCRRL